MEHKDMYGCDLSQGDFIVVNLGGTDRMLNFGRIISINKMQNYTEYYLVSAIVIKKGLDGTWKSSTCNFSLGCNCFIKVPESVVPVEILGLL